MTRRKYNLQEIPLQLTINIYTYLKFSVSNKKLNSTERPEKTHMAISNVKLKDYTFLNSLILDPYYPNDLVKKGQDILKKLCDEIEATKPESVVDFYMLTHKATNKFNVLAEEFMDNNSEIETMAREVIGIDFDLIAEAYSYDTDSEEIIATRDW